MRANILKGYLGKRLRALATGALALCLSACSTITFVQHQQGVDAKSVNRWHHSTLNGMVEISKPLDIRTICDTRAWTTVSTEFTLLNALPVILVPSTSLVSFYSAWTNKVQCYEVGQVGPRDQASQTDHGI